MDYIQDLSGRHLLNLASLVEEPAYVKNSSLEPEDIAKLKAHEFADPVRREFPIHTPGHTFISYGYCKSAGIRNPDILQRIRKAGELHKIDSDLKSIDNAFTAAVKSASAPMARYAIELDFGTPKPEAQNQRARAGGVQGFYPINDALELEDSARKLANHRNQIPLELWVEGCREVVKVASEMNVPVTALPPAVVSYGVPRLSDKAYVKIAASKRHRLTGDPIYNDIAEAFAAETDPDLDAYAGLWKQADDQNNLSYSRSVEDPWQILNSGKTAAAHQQEMDSWTLLCNAPVPVDVIKSANEAKIRKFFAKPEADTLLEFTKSAKEMIGPDITNLAAGLNGDLARRFLGFLTR